MQQTEEYGCLTQHSQIDRLRELADEAARARVRGLDATELMPATVIVIDGGGKESTWDLNRLALARPGSTAVQLLLHPEIALDNLVPTQAIVRILRDTNASAVALVAPASPSMAALQIADLDHEQSLTARIDRQPDHEPMLSKWDFGKVAWTVRLRQALRAARGAAGPRAEEVSSRPSPASTGTRPSDPTPSRRNQRREMREQLYRAAAPAPSWLQ